MQPSERIEQIRKAMAKESGLTTPEAHLLPAIIKYLDERWEQEHPDED